MRNVLVYIEPHPIRNYYEEFHNVGQLLCQSMLQLGARSGYDFRYVSNDSVIDRIITDNAALSYLSLRFTAEENKYLESLYGQWNIKTINEWLSLVNGEGPASDFYISVLDRLHKEYPFEAILLWSDNGAVRRFCRKHDIAVLHGEYGPTRAPFHQTIYFDPNGTNGAAAVLQAPLHKLHPKIVVPRETWVTRQGKEWNDEKAVGLIDSPCTLQKDLVFKQEFTPPYLFIPLQLEDDLNTQLYSEFKTPESFLRHIIPEALEMGLAVVVKGHPAAMGRTFNLIAQTKALNYARSMGERVTVIPHTTTAFESINIMAQAVAVATINSSVGFEALLLGKSIYLYGTATYDVGGKLCTPDKTLNLERITQPDHAHLDKLTSFLCCHYLHPIESVTKGNALATVLDYIFETKSKPTDTEEFWQGWMDRIDYGYEWLSQSSTKTPFSTARDTGPLAGNRLIFEGGSKNLFMYNGEIHVTAINNGEHVLARAKNETNSIIGFIDSLTEVTENDNAYLQISGWALDRTLRPPIQILFCHHDKIISSHRILTIRRDVAEEFKTNIAPRCGFTFNVDKTYASEMKNCRLVFLSSNNLGYAMPLSKGSIHVMDGKDRKA